MGRPGPDCGYCARNMKRKQRNYEKNYEVNWDKIPSAFTHLFYFTSTPQTHISQFEY